MESQSIWRAQGCKDAEMKHQFLYHQSTGTDKKVLSTLDMLWELQILIILEGRENAARRERSYSFMHALYTYDVRLSRVFLPYSEPR